MSSKLAGGPVSTLDKQAFCRNCGKFATGITVVTVLDDAGGPHGMTANSFTSVSLEPPLVLVCVDHRARILKDLRTSKHFGINILEEHQKALSSHFARSAHDRFDGIEFLPGHTGVPLLPGMLSTMECEIRTLTEAGDHTIVVGEVIHATCHDGKPLIYFGSHYRHLAE
jgi:flavin reductase (DIM6/NTAB) family NADH-FMN oxidoreductase RutF